jgi:glycosyl-4,4'-diaponeurosporenoate acyltransferase
MAITSGRRGPVMTSGDLSPGWVILLNAGAWLVIQLGSAVFFSLVPLARFVPRGKLFRARAWERDGRIYDRILRVHAWKRVLPDGAALFRSGFRKRRMSGRSPGYCTQFVQETCRAELSHWIALALLPLFFIWNPWQIALLMIPYAISTNVPCIVAQRYNRPRLSALANRRVDSPGNHATAGAEKLQTAHKKEKQRAGKP